MLLVSIALVVAALSYIMPAGVYDRVTDPVSGREVVDPDSFHYVEKSPVGFIEFLSSYTGGFLDAASTIFMTLVVGGTFGIIYQLGIIPAALALEIGRASCRERV